MNELDCKRMLTIAKQIRNVATNEGWSEDDQTLILAKLAISAYEEIGRLKADKMVLRTVCREAMEAFGETLARTAKVEE